MIDYIFLITASLLFSVQFMFNQRFQQINGDGIAATLLFTIYSSVIGLAVLLAANGLRLQITFFSFCIAVLYSAVNILYFYSSIKSFSVVNLGLYSVFAMLGGMLLPFLYGVILANEEMTWTKAICCAVIAASMFLTLSDIESKSKNAVLYYVMVFVLNGMVGVLSAIHQSRQGINVDSTSFIALTKIIMIVICSLLLFAGGGRLKLIDLKSMGCAAGFSIANTVGNLLVLIALIKLPASVQYPIITGGTMIFSSLISIAKKEKFTLRNGAVVAMSFAASVIIAL